MDFTDEPAELTVGTPFFLGVLGSRADANQEQIQEIMTLLLQEIGKVPERLILPSEGTSSIWVSDWAETLKIPTQVYEADWFRHQRKAKVLRDARIQKEATHFLIFLNKRSAFYESLAERLTKKGHTVFTIT